MRRKRSSNKIPFPSPRLALKPRSPCQFLDTSFKQHLLKCIFKLPLRAPHHGSWEIIMFNNSIIDGTFVSSTFTPPPAEHLHITRNGTAWRLRRWCCGFAWRIIFIFTSQRINQIIWTADDSAINVHKYVWLALSLVQTSSNGQRTGCDTFMMGNAN